MESADLNSSANANDDARLEAMLRRASPALPDNGFSARVLAALPPEAEATPWRRIAFCVAGAAAGCGFALWQGVSWPELQADAAQFSAKLANAGSALDNPMFGAALVVTALSLLVAFRTELREKLRS